MDSFLAAYPKKLPFAFKNQGLRWCNKVVPRDDGNYDALDSIQIPAGVGLEGFQNPTSHAPAV